MNNEREQYRIDAQRQFKEHEDALDSVLASQLDTIASMAETVVRCYREGHKVIWCGNGGSAADAQHLSAELVGRYLFDRPPLPSIALHTDTSALTAIGNDFGYDQVFSRQAEAFLSVGDVLVCLSTSGRSRNVIAAAEVARAKGCEVLGLIGNDGGGLLPLCDLALVVPSNRSYVIQQVSMMAGHFLCDAVERAIFAPVSH